MNKLSEAYPRLIQAAYSEDYEIQAQYLSMIEDQRKIPVSYLMERGLLFIPNNDYIVHHLGMEARQHYFGFYADERCLWTLFVIIPIQDLTGETVGIVGWDAWHKYKEVSEGEQGLQMYSVSNKSIFLREKYFLTDVKLLRETFDRRTVFITDGVFDSVSLNYHGIPAIALLGSSFTREILYFLRWYKRIYVCADNDSAGLNLYNRLHKSLPNVYRVVQGQTKDIEELLRGDGHGNGVASRLRQVLVSNVIGDIYLDKRP